jgi:hypothetical protein
MVPVEYRGKNIGKDLESRESDVEIPVGMEPHLVR